MKQPVTELVVKPKQTRVRKPRAPKKASETKDKCKGDVSEDKEMNDEILLDMQIEPISL